MSQTVLITGASRGIGAETARRFAAGGYQVAVNYFQSKDAAFALCDEIGNGAFPVYGDVSDSAQVRAMVDEVFAHVDHLDALVCNAGISLPGMLLQDVTDQQWADVLSVDASGVFYAVRAVLPHMLHQHAGRIVTVSSMWGQVGASCEVAYSAAKAGVIGFTKALAKEVGPSGITVNCIAPGVVDTEMNAGLSGDTRKELKEETPLGRLGTPLDVAKACIFLSSEDGAFITGQVLGVNGGLVIV